MTNEVAKVLAGSLEPLYNAELITVLCGLTKVATQKKYDATTTVRFPVPYDYDSPVYQIEKSQLVPDKKQRAIVYFEGNDTDITSFVQNKSKGRTGLRLVCWYNSSAFESPINDSIHSQLASKMLDLLWKAKPRPDGVIGGMTVEVTRILDSAGSLFSRYSYKEDYGQYLQNPYFAFGIDISVTYQINHGCTTELVPVDAGDCC